MHELLTTFSPGGPSNLKRPAFRIDLAVKPTPVRRWCLPGMPDDIELFIKRDDMTGCTLSGNKARKLEFLMAAALADGADTVITRGGIQSNHARATAVAAAELGLRSHLILNCDDPDEPTGQAGNLLLEKVTGAVIHPVTLDRYLEGETVSRELAAVLKAKGAHSYVIPEGGSDAIGTWGYIEAAAEIAGQSAQAGLHFTDVVCACGSGGTAAGLAAGFQRLDYRTCVHAVNVCRHADYFSSRCRAILDELGAPDDGTIDLDFIDGYVGKGYARTTNGEMARILRTARKTGIILDHVYTGKACAGLIAELQLNRDRFRGDRILFVHTGGLFSLFALEEAIFETQ